MFHRPWHNGPTGKKYVIANVIYPRDCCNIKYSAEVHFKSNYRRISTASNIYVSSQTALKCCSAYDGDAQNFKTIWQSDGQWIIDKQDSPIFGS